MSNMLDKARAIEDELVRLRRDIHAHPELSFEETRTAQLVADTLREIGYDDIKMGVGRTGVVAEIGNGDGPTIGIRADMDALPIHEATEAEYASKNPGVMHACGHDAHTSMLLGAAHLLRQSLAEEKWNGTVRLIFQPSEEKVGDDGISGGNAMVADKALEGVDHVIALHVISELPSGVCVFNDGYSLAAGDSFQAWIRGTGGHGAFPHNGSDPVHMLSLILPAIYAIPSRRIDPIQSSVISIGQIQAGAASNVIPAEVYLQGTIRSYEKAVRQQLFAELENVFKIAETLGGSYEFKIKQGYPSMFNHKQVNDWMRDISAEFGQPVLNHPFGMGSEDFSYMTEAAPGAMFMLGAAIPDGVVRSHHTPIFDIDEAVLPVGAAIMAETARRYVLGQIKAA